MLCESVREVDLHKLYVDAIAWAASKAEEQQQAYEKFLKTERSKIEVNLEYSGYLSKLSRDRAGYVALLQSFNEKAIVPFVAHRFGLSKEKFEDKVIAALKASEPLRRRLCDLYLSPPGRLPI